jgi:hypothetical protein
MGQEKKGIVAHLAKMSATLIAAAFVLTLGAAKRALGRPYRTRYRP